MSNKPVSQRQATDNRQAIWSMIRDLKKFTISELQAATTMRIQSVREYCQGLAAAGFIELDPAMQGKKATPGKPLVWILKRDCGVDAPVVRKDGTLVTRSCRRLQMWRTMKVLVQFSLRDLVVHASLEDSVVDEGDAKDYLNHLCHAGYLVRRKNGQYLFLRSQNTGPQAPMVQKVKQVWDPNLSKVMWSENDEPPTTNTKRGDDHGRR